MRRRSHRDVEFHVGDKVFRTFDHGGGIVFQGDHGPELEYIVPPETPKRRSRWEIYRVSLDDPDGAREWLRRGGVASFTGVSPKRYEQMLRSGNPVAEALVWEDIAAYYGWHELDQYPLRLTAREVYERYGEEPEVYD